MLLVLVLLLMLSCSSIQEDLKGKTVFSKDKQDQDDEVYCSDSTNSNNNGQPRRLPQYYSLHDRARNENMIAKNLNQAKQFVDRHIDSGPLSKVKQIFNAPTARKLPIPRFAARDGTISSDNIDNQNTPKKFNLQTLFKSIPDQFINASKTVTKFGKDEIMKLAKNFNNQNQAKPRPILDEHNDDSDLISQVRRIPNTSTSMRRFQFGNREGTIAPDNVENQHTPDKLNLQNLPKREQFLRQLFNISKEVTRFGKDEIMKLVNNFNNQNEAETTPFSYQQNDPDFISEVEPIPSAPTSVRSSIPRFGTREGTISFDNVENQDTPDKFNLLNLLKSLPSSHQLFNLIKLVTKLDKDEIMKLANNLNVQNGAETASFLDQQNNSDFISEVEPILSAPTSVRSSIPRFGTREGTISFDNVENQHSPDKLNDENRPKSLQFLRGLFNVSKVVTRFGKDEMTKMIKNLNIQNEAESTPSSDQQNDSDFISEVKPIPSVPTSVRSSIPRFGTRQGSILSDNVENQNTPDKFNLQTLFKSIPDQLINAGKTFTKFGTDGIMKLANNFNIQNKPETTPFVRSSIPRFGARQAIISSDNVESQNTSDKFNLLHLLNSLPFSDQLFNLIKLITKLDKDEIMKLANNFNIQIGAETAPLLDKDNDSDLIPEVRRLSIVPCSDDDENQNTPDKLNLHDPAKIALPRKSSIDPDVKSEARKHTDTANEEDDASSCNSLGEERIPSSLNPSTGFDRIEDSSATPLHQVRSNTKNDETDPTQSQNTSKHPTHQGPMHSLPVTTLDADDMDNDECDCVNQPPPAKDECAINRESVSREDRIAMLTAIFEFLKDVIIEGKLLRNDSFSRMITPLVRSKSNVAVESHESETGPRSDEYTPTTDINGTPLNPTNAISHIIEAKIPEPSLEQQSTLSAKERQRSNTSNRSFSQTIVYAIKQMIDNTIDTLFDKVRNFAKQLFAGNNLKQMKLVDEPHGKEHIWKQLPSARASTRHAGGKEAHPDNRTECSNCECGTVDIAKKRIVGGANADVNQYPWIVILFVVNSVCGSSLINNQYLLTAAHCVDHPTYQPKQIKATFLYHQKGGSIPSFERRISSINVHEHYDRNTQQHDIALLRLETPVYLDENIRPICLPPAGPDYAGQTGTIMGWGALRENGTVSGTLQQAKVPILSNNDCMKSDYSDAIQDTMLCAGFMQGGRDSCQGDSGGPLYVIDNKRAALAGVTSFGVGCARPNLPGVYSRVNKYLSWIKDNTRDGCYCRQG